MNIQKYSLQSVSTETVNGHTIGVRQSHASHTAKVIVMIHGIGVSSTYYVPLAEELAKEYTVIALDLPGYGKTPKPAHPLTINELADVAYAFLQKHAIINPIIIGHSMGCQISAKLNAIAPGYLHKMILLSPTVNRKERSVIMQAMRLFQDTFYERPIVNYIIFSDYLRMGVLRFLRTSRNMVTTHIEDALANNSTQTLIIRGENDHIVPKDWVSYLATLSKVHLAKEVPKSPHAFHYKFAKETALLCKTYIET